MTKYSNYYGIDVSKLTLDIVNQKGEHLQVPNNEKGFKKLHKILPKDSLCIMEVTGVYHIQLALFLYSKEIPLSVVNPLKIKRFIQMHLQRNKTDKSDAKMICLYGQTQQVELWEPNDPILEECKDIYAAMDHYIDIRAGLKRKIDSLNSKKAFNFLIKNIEKQILSLDSAIEELEKTLIEKVKSYDSALLTNIKSIKGIGERTAILLMIFTNGFKNFESSKQLSSYFGLAPTQTSSGISINKVERISKMGNPLVRKKLYMCSLQASVSNKACRDLFQRIVAKGKPKKVALVAVANKLLKIAFAISKSGLPYDPYYKSVKIEKSILKTR
tara:strand:+ start:314 stop:1300 length:987 start_codon:yes stop_codon:yes gene_type:complete